jgi:hypothetical protein
MILPRFNMFKQTIQPDRCRTLPGQIQNIGCVAGCLMSATGLTRRNWAHGCIAQISFMSPSDRGKFFLQSDFGAYDPTKWRPEVQRRS